MKRVTGILAAAVAAAFVFAGAAPALAAGPEDPAEVVRELVALNPGATEAQLHAAAEEAARESGLSTEETLLRALEEAKASVEAASAAEVESAPRSSGNKTVRLGAARHAGDIFVSPSATLFVQHGHTGIYHTTTSVVDAPGVGQRSRASDARWFKVGRGAVKQSVSVSTAKRNAAASHAYNRLRGKEYNMNFMFNKSTTGAQMNCSQLVWAAYKAGAGIDLDSNGGGGVYPYDIKHSPLTRTYQTL